MENVTLLRKSRTDDSAIIFNPLTDFYSIVSEQGNITEESDELSSLLASGSWRRPLKEEISDFSFDPSKEPKLQIPSINTGDIIKALELGKASRSTAFNIKDDLEKLAKWAEDVSEEMMIMSLKLKMMDGNIMLFRIKKTPVSLTNSGLAIQKETFCILKIPLLFHQKKH